MLFALLSKRASHHRELPDSSEFHSRMSERHWRVTRQNVHPTYFDPRNRARF